MTDVDLEKTVAEQDYTEWEAFLWFISRYNPIKKIKLAGLAELQKTTANIVRIAETENKERESDFLNNSLHLGKIYALKSKKDCFYTISEIVRNEEKKIVLFWSKVEFANRFLDRNDGEFHPIEISLSEFVGDILKVIIENGAVVGINFTEYCVGPVLNPIYLQNSIKKCLEKVEGGQP